MTEASDRINAGKNFLAHYASIYYDPIKAHDYYVKNRQLKGKSQGKDLDISTQKGKNAPKGVKAQAYLQKTNQINKSAEARRDQIIARVDGFLASIDSDTPIPADASPRLRAFLENQRKLRANNEIEKANKDLRKVVTDLRTALNAARAAYNASR